MKTFQLIILIFLDEVNAKIIAYRAAILIIQSCPSINESETTFTLTETASRVRLNNTLITSTKEEKMGQNQLQEVCLNEIIEGKNYFIIETGNSCNSKKEILDYLLLQRPGLKEKNSVADSHVILVFCTICSRTGTDIDAAMNELNSGSESKPAIFIVLHHTFDSDKTVPESSRYVTRMNTLTVDCLFHEDVGLLKCKRNDEALTKIVQHFKHQDQSEAVLSYLPWYIILPIRGLYYIFVTVKSAFVYAAKAIWNYFRGTDGTGTDASRTNRKRAV